MPGLFFFIFALFLAAAFMNLVWGSWGDPEPDQLRGFVIFNHPDPPEADENLSSDFEIEVGT